MYDEKFAIYLRNFIMFLDIPMSMSTTFYLLKKKNDRKFRENFNWSFSYRHFTWRYCLRSKGEKGEYCNPGMTGNQFNDSNAPS